MTSLSHTSINMLTEFLRGQYAWADQGLSTMQHVSTSVPFHLQYGKYSMLRNRKNLKINSKE